DRGTTVLFLGPAGVGKSALGTQYAVAAADRGEKSAIYLFDESAETYCWRAAGVDCDVQSPQRRGLISLEAVDVAAMSPGEFTQHVRDAVDAGARLIVIDSLNGLLNAMPE